jgi:hypothetical protein
MHYNAMQEGTHQRQTQSPGLSNLRKNHDLLVPITYLRPVSELAVPSPTPLLCSGGGNAIDMQNNA